MLSRRSYSSSKNQETDGYKQMGKPLRPSAVVGVMDSHREPHAAQLSSFSIGIEAEDYTNLKCDLTGGNFPPPVRSKTQHSCLVHCLSHYIEMLLKI